jgi:hypothetical protein
MMIHPAGILRNRLTGRFHPIVFRYAPPPSGGSRYKSIGHHTDGFDTLDQAEEYIASRSEWTNTGMRWNWSGEDVPALTVWF